MKLNSLYLLLTFLCGIVAIPSTATKESRPFQIEFRDGTIVTRQFADQSLMWTNVSDMGQMSKKPIEVDLIESLVLTREPASEKLAQILKLIENLDSDEFFVREAAEDELTESGSRFRSLLERKTKLSTPDGTYRLQRVLSSMRREKKEQGIALDVLTLKDGTRLTGDAGSEDIEFVSASGQSFSVARKLIASVTTANTKLTTRAESREVVETKLFHSHADFMEGRTFKLEDFELKPDGSPLRTLDKNISDLFVPKGLILGTEFPMGCVGISGYEIKGGDRPVGGNSICVYQSKTRTVRRFQGVMEITFCQPGKKNVPHGVRDIGMFISRVNHSRDIVLEGYDAAGRLIGVCESSDEPCTFCGISSTVPIAKVRVLSNPWMLELRKLNVDPSKRAGQKVDKDFAVDSIMYSKPVPVDSLRKDRHYLGKNGDMVKANWIRIFGKDRIELGSQNVQLMEIGFDEANTIKLKPTPKTLRAKATQAKWLAMLRDNSVLQWSTVDFLKSNTLNQKIDRADVVAIWPTGREPHLPLQDDFESGKNVLVYPGCRVASPKVEFDARGFRWDSEQILTEDLHDDNEYKVDQRPNDQPDPVAPRKKKFDWSIRNLPEYEIPTIWFEKPTSLLSNQGAIKLDGGEVLVFGKDALFQLESIERKQVKLTFGGKEVTVPISKVTSILAPQE